MAFAPDLHGAFLFGEGVHGWWNRKTGRYMDDLWFYDVPGHRWICVYPGTEVTAYRKALTEDGFEADAEGRPVPVASMAHAYEMVTYDTHTRQFLSMPCPGDYWNAIQGRREFLQQQKGKLNRDHASPWMYDTVAGRWDRLKTRSASPASGFGGSLVYLAARERVFFYQPGDGVHYYYPAWNDWSEVKARGTPATVWHRLDLLLRLSPRPDLPGRRLVPRGAGQQRPVDLGCEERFVDRPQAQG